MSRRQRLLCALLVALVVAATWSAATRAASPTIDVRSRFPFALTSGDAVVRIVALTVGATSSDDVWSADAVPDAATSAVHWSRLEQRRAIVTLMTNEAYLLAGTVLAHSLVRVNTTLPVVALISDELARNESVLVRLALAGFSYAAVVRTLDNPAHDADAQLSRGKKAQRVQDHKRDVFTKLRVFALDAFEQLLFVDADCVVLENIDHLLLSRADVAFAFAPSLQPLDKCESAAARHYRFTDGGREWCQSHSRDLYHGTMDLKHHNTGVMLLRPSRAVFDELVQLMQQEPHQNDTCIGQPGCNDQRIINMYFHTHAHATLELRYNIFCDQLLSLGFSLAEFRPAVVHYRGQSKPWALDNFRYVNHTPSDSPSAVVRVAPRSAAQRHALFGGDNVAAWAAKDRCGSFVDALQSLIGAVR